MKWFKFFLIPVYILIITSIYAKDRIITLNECINIALQNNPNIFISIEDKEKAVSEYKYVKAKSDILIDGEIKTIERLKATASPTGTFNVPGQDTTLGLFAGITATYSLYDGTVNRMQDLYRVKMDYSKIEAQKSVNTIILGVKKAYYTYIMAKEALKIREQLLKRNLAKLNLAKIYFKSGQKPILDVTKAEVAYTEAQLEFEKAKNNERLARSELYTTMGIEDNGIDIVLQDNDELPEIKFSIDELYQLGELYYPDIRLIKMQKRISKLQIAVERSYHNPKIKFALSFGAENSDIFNTSFAFSNLKKWKPIYTGGITATFPLYSGGAIEAKVDSAKNDYNKMVYKEKESIMKMKNDIRNFYNDLNEISKQIKIAKLNIGNAEKHLLLAKKSYENGLVSQLELQDAQVSVINAELGYHRAKSEYFLTLAKISQIVGLGEDALCKK